MARVTREEAMQDPTVHTLRLPAGGYHHVGHLPMPPNGAAGPAVQPLLDAKHGSFHLLKPPGGGKAIRFEWDAERLIWLRHGGNRLAWTAEYLGAHGWKYGKATK